MGQLYLLHDFSPNNYTLTTDNKAGVVICPYLKDVWEDEFCFLH